jgi:hypothetical protein
MVDVGCNDERRDEVCLDAELKADTGLAWNC